MATAKKPAEGEKTVTILIPRTKENKGDVFVSVNERTWQIKRGVKVNVPECVAEVIRNAEDAEERRLAFEDEIAH